MKVFISADIEGICGIASWEEATRGKADYAKFAAEMQLEVAAACNGAIHAGAHEILVRDAHDTARNLDFSGLPQCVKLIRGFNGHPFCMMFGLQDSFDAVMMIGYHSMSGSGTSPLAHTLDPAINYIEINGIRASEFYINALTAAYAGVPVVFVSGDEALCQHVHEINEHITLAASGYGVGAAMFVNNPQVFLQEIEEKAADSLNGDLRQCLLSLPDTFRVEISYKESVRAYRASFYPGASPVTSTNIIFDANDYFEVLRFFSFVA